MNNIFFDISKLKSCGNNVIIGKTVRIRNPELVEIGDNVIIDDFSYISGIVKIGNFCHIGSSCTIQAGTASVTIEDYSGISAGVRVFAVSSDYISPSFDLPTIPFNFRVGSIIDKIHIAKHVLIGSNSVVLPGVNLPEGVAFAAQSTISKRKYISWALYGDKCRKPIYIRNKETYLNKLNDYHNSLIKIKNHE